MHPNDQYLDVPQGCWQASCQWHPGSVLILAIAVLTSASAATAQQPAGAIGSTPNTFLQRGAPTFVVGTGGDDLADNATRAQADLIRGMISPKSKIIDDTTIDVTKGPAGWPANPVLYGGQHVNTILKRLEATLPFKLEPGKLTIGGQTFAGDEYRVLAVIPARKADADGPGYPEFLLYAGTGTPGIGEINAVHHGSEAILIADSFGRLLVGYWQAGDGGRATAKFPQPRLRRIPWRTEARKLKTASGGITLHCRFPKQLPAADDEAAVITACGRGLSRAVKTTGIDKCKPITVYIYSDRGSIRSLTGSAGDGHAAVAARTLHVIKFNTARNGPLEGLVAHEVTHVLTYEAWGPAGTPLLGEGAAVWACDMYGGTSLAKWRKQLAKSKRPAIANLLGKSFRQLPEQQTYPLAGIFFAAAVKEVGLENVRKHLYGATPPNWQQACTQAGTTPAKLQAAFEREFGGR